MAAPIIKLKRSAVEGKIPTTANVPLGELALNTYDGYLYASKDVGAGVTVIAINPWRVGTGTNTYNAYFTQGNVGIGSTLPTELLDVSGTIKAQQLNVTGLSTFAGLVDINAGGQANTFKVEDLTSGRVVLAGTGGELEDSANLTFDGSTLTVNGDVSIGGTLTYEDVTNIDSIGIITARSGIVVTSGGLDVTGVSTFKDNIHLLDTDKLQIGGAVGTVDGLEIFHSGDHSYIDETGTGNLYIRGDQDLYIVNNNGTETKARFSTDGPVELYYDNSKKFETTASGIDVTGHTETDTLNVSGISTFASALDINADVHVSGVVTATSFVGPLTGTASTSTTVTVTPNGDNTAYRVPFTSGVTGDVSLYTDTQDGIAYNPSTNTLFSGFFSGDGSNLTGITASAAPAGSDGQIQYNNGGVTGGASEVYYDDANNRLGIGAAAPGAKLHVSGSARIGGTNSAYRRADFTTDGILTLGYADNNNISNLVLQNLDTNATTNHGNNILWQFGTNTSQTALNAAKIAAVKEQQWTSTTSTQDSALIFETALNGTISEKVRITSGGNFGVGTNAPGAKLHVESAATTAGWQIRTDSVGLSNESGFYRDASDHYEMVLRNGLGGLSYIKNNGGASTANLIFHVQGGERLTILSDGNVGINENSPDHKLHVQGDIGLRDHAVVGTVDNVTTTSTTQTAVASLSASTYRSVEFTVQATEGTNYHVIKVLVIHDGTTAYNTQYGEMFTNTSVSSFDADISGGNIRLLGTSASANSTVYKVTFQGTKV